MDTKEKADRLFRAEMICREAEAKNRRLHLRETEDIASLLDGITHDEIPQDSILRKPQPRVSDPIAIENPGSHFDRTRSMQTLPGVTVTRDLKTGREVPVLSREGHFSDLAQLRHPDEDVRGYSLHRLLRGWVTGEWAHAPLEKRALAEGVNTSGGIMVPDQISSMLIDYARNASVMVQAGTLSIPMTSDRITIPRLTADPTFGVYPENTSMGDVDLAFDGVSMTAYKVGCIVLCSRELISDASTDVGNIVSNTLAKALATKIDYLCLRGSGSAEPRGVSGTPGVQTITSIGTADYDDWLDAAELLYTANAVPRTTIMLPGTYIDLSKLTTGDGTNASKDYRTPPSEFQNMQRLISNQCASGTAYTGDFTSTAIGLRQEMRIDVSDQYRFDADQIAFRITWRGDFAALRPADLVVMSGIS